ncbi:unnamed protein product [Ilex paraguariensis]|uniref:RING-type domain-containing protein n=1 Tax=Ilex paraguariensis TaxID=185542 RepID=A0ABC8UE56_9AQUA
MEYQHEFIAKLSDSEAMAVTTTITVIVCIVFFAAHLFFKHLRHGHRLRSLTLRYPNHGNMSQNLYCSICLHYVSGNESYRKLPKCHHCFHVDCIDAWFQSSSTCPLCRSQVPDLPQQKQGSFSSYFLSLPLNFLRKMGESLNYELTLTLCVNARNPYLS